MSRGAYWSVWRQSAATSVAAAAFFGLKLVGLRPFAVFGLLGPALAFSLCMAPSGGAAPGTPAKERLVKKEVTGEVVARTSRTLSLETSKTGNASEEMLLPVDPAVVKLERLVSLADLKPGDRVRVEYRQRFQEIAEDEFRLMWSEATKISLLGRAMSGPRQVLQGAPDEGGGP